jgi:hypothetical protein
VTKSVSDMEFVCMYLCICAGIIITCMYLCMFFMGLCLCVYVHFSQEEMICDKISSQSITMAK